MFIKQSAIILVIFLFNGCWGDTHRIELDQGGLIGQDMLDRNGDTFYSFQSIPFAKPPIGELRFKEPEEAEPWDTDLDATIDLPICTQDYYDGTTIGVEDCLYLNVYTKQLQTTGNDVSLPVMVWIYGGGFVENAGRQDLFSPEFLLTEDIVLVTVNYRVGIFGSFHLSDPTLGYPGNLGLKDQSLALKWVQDNIAKFGGNPDSVTIFGESAGGASVHLHVLSPLSAGRFHKAIIQSGTAIGPWVTGVRNNGILLADELEVSTDDPEEMIEELLTFTNLQILAAQNTIQQASTARWGSISAPIIEENVEGQNNFITEEPLTIIENGNYNHVSLMVGYNDREGISFHPGYSSVANFIPGDLGIETDSDLEAELIAELRSFYFGDDETTDNTAATIQIFTDVYFSYPAYRLAIEHQKTATEPIYFYRFSADTLLNVYKLRNNDLAAFPGATHCDELGYLFLTRYHEEVTGDIIANSVEDIGINRIVTLWTNFAKYGNPTPDDGSTTFTWLPVTDDTFNYVNFETVETVPGVDPDSENMQFWSDIYEKYDGAGQEESITVTIDQGVLVGQEMEDFQGNTFYSFQSIPYAKPPVDELRFKEPEEAEGWVGDRNATTDLPFCYQQDADGNTIGQEDCLYLNVYTKDLPTEENDVSLDVMVWIHGGGFIENSGRQDLYSPEFLLSRDIVLVTLNYRLGLFGSFHLSNTTLEYPGNLGLKDQALALRWVQSNIANFGGNPGSVTIFGESAGGAAVHYHVLSPLSAGTFHKAIIQSGTAISPWSIGIQNNGVLLAEALEIETEDATAMVDALLALDGDAIFAASVELIEEYGTGWAQIQSPIVEEEVEGLNNFITEEPLDIIQSGTYNDVPIMVGYTDAEGILFFQTEYTSLASFIPDDLVIEDSDTEAELIEELQNFYFNGSETGEATELIQLYTDAWFSYPAVRLAREHVETANSSIYFYRFSADTQLNVYKLINTETAGFAGACHQDELAYLFKTNYHDTLIPTIAEGTTEYTHLENLVTLWVNFATTGNPTPEGFTDYTWEPVTSEELNYIDFGTEGTVVGVDPDTERIQFWTDVYEKYSSGVSFRVQPLVILFSFVIAYLRY